MIYTITQDTLSAFVKSMQEEIGSNGSVTIDFLGAKEKLYLQSDDYLHGMTNEFIDSKDFINELKGLVNDNKKA